VEEGVLSGFELQLHETTESEQGVGGGKEMDMKGGLQIREGEEMSQPVERKHCPSFWYVPKISEDRSHDFGSIIGDNEVIEI
jgi:hypothetical protein